MLTLIIPETQLYNNKTNEFKKIKETKLQLEHSLVSLSKWESKWGKPFLSKEQKTKEQMIDYIRCMTITQNVPDDIYKCINIEHIKQINEYIENPMTATTFKKNQKWNPIHEQTTAELLYYRMIAHNIPSEYQKWHLNRLLTLLRVCDIKNQPNKKQPKTDTIKQYAALNKARRAGKKG